MSSIYAKIRRDDNPERHKSIIRWYDAPALVNPYGVTLNSYFPRGTAKAVFSLSSSDRGIDQYADAASKVVQNLLPSILSTTSRM